MDVNLHINLTPLRNESRILKETASLLAWGLIQEVHVAGVHEEGLPEAEEIDKRRFVRRFRLRTRGWPKNLLVQLVKYCEFSVRVLAYSRKNSVTVVTIHRLALLPLGVLVKWLFRARLVYDCHELETETYGLTGIRQILSRVVERSLIGQAEMVMVVSESIADWYRSRYRIGNVYTVQNCPPYRPPSRSSLLREKLGIAPEKRIVIYQGGIIPGRGVEGLLRAFSEWNDGRHVLVFMGYGSLEDLVAQSANESENIFLLKAVPPELVLDHTASADVGVAYIDNPSLNDYFCLPNKLFEYVMAGLPVMVNDVPEMRRLVEENQIGVVLGALTADSIRCALEEIGAMDQGELSQRIHRTAEASSWENQEKVLLEAHRRRVLF